MHLEGEEAEGGGRALGPDPRRHLVEGAGFRVKGLGFRV